MGIARIGLTGRKSGITTVAAQLSSLSTVVNEGVQLVAPTGNGEAVYVGYGSGITANSGDSTDGFPISPGAGLFLPCRHVNDIWVRSVTLSNLSLWYIGQ